jgi:hypothetical protein
MQTINLDLWLPADPAIVGVVLGAAVIYVVYRMAKLISSFVTGAG